MPLRVGTAPHLAGLLFARLAGVRMEHVPYKGNAESVRALLANEVQVYFASVSAGLEQVASGAGDSCIDDCLALAPAGLSRCAVGGGVGRARPERIELGPGRAIRNAARRSREIGGGGCSGA